MGGDGDPMQPWREGPPGRRINRTNSSFGSSVGFGGIGGNSVFALRGSSVGQGCLLNNVNQHNPLHCSRPKMQGLC